MARIKIADVLSGCESQRMQSVGVMQVIPLTSDIVDEDFSFPTKVSKSTRNYGTVQFNNSTEDDVIIPKDTAYMTKSASQDHAVPTAVVVPKGTVKQVDTSMCIQDTQGGIMPSGEHDTIVMPLVLREDKNYFKNRAAKSYDRLWPALRKMNKEVGSSGQPGHLVDFFKSFQQQLEVFVAEFEPVPDQVGAIILINGKVVGIEKTPNYEYWLEIWPTLIRDCYGSMALSVSNKITEPTKMPKTRKALKKSNTLADLKSALKDANDKEYAKAGEIVNNVCKVELDRKVDSKTGVIKIEGLGDTENTFTGQILSKGDAIVYASLTATKYFRENQNRFDAKSFSM